MGLESLRTRTFGSVLSLAVVQQSLIDPQINRDLVSNKGHEAVGHLLIDLQVRKATADAAGATEFYTKLTTPPDGWTGELRELVLSKRQVNFFWVYSCSSLNAGLILPCSQGKSSCRYG
jgi:Peptidase family M49